jgi:hypothetical protein
MKRGRIVTAVCLVASWTAASAAAATPALRVIPFPGTPDAAPSSQIIFSALRPSEVGSVSVIGTRSGLHRGHIQALPVAAGAAFVPVHRFRPGETVRVSAELNSPQAGTESGDPGATRLSFSFTVAPAVGRLPVIRAWPTAGPGGAGDSFSAAGLGPTQRFHSAPDLIPPRVSISPDLDPSSGDIFLTPQNSPQVGPMILDGSGQLVWFHPLWHGSKNHYTGNFAVQRYRGKPVLTWWQGMAPDGVIERPSYDVIMDQSYRTVARVHAGNGYVADLHEFQITPRGTAYLDSPVLTKTDLSSVGGPSKGSVMDYVIQEVDIRTGKVLWEWHALGHVPVSASRLAYSPKQLWYDYFHLNSIQELPDGNLLVSARDTCAVYEISRRTGKVLWTLGGKYSNFKAGRGANFEWQHDARLHGHTLSLFDDAAQPQEEPESSAKYLRIDPANRTASLIRKFDHNPPLLAGAGGSTQTLPSGNVFVGWGSEPVFSEFTARGRQIFNGSFALGVVSYRAFRHPWTAHPQTRPALAVSRKHGHTTIYASWNGATQVTAWRVLGGPAAHRLRPLGPSAPRNGFETQVRLKRWVRFLAVQALDKRGRVLGTSAVAGHRR